NTISDPRHAGAITSCGPGSPQRSGPPMPPQRPRRAVRKPPNYKASLQPLEPRILMAEGPSTFRRKPGDPHPLPLSPIELQPHQTTMATSPLVHAARRRKPGPLGAAETVLPVPGQPGQIVSATFTLSSRTKGARDELGFFPVDDSSGRIGSRNPGDPG